MPPLAHRFRLYPFPDQERELRTQFSELAFLWNHALEERREAWKNERRSVGYVDQCRSLTRWRRHDRMGIGRVNAQVAQECLARLNDAFLAFFERRSRYPHFKRETTSLTYPQAPGSVALVPGRNGTRRLRLSRVGDVPIEVHREVPEGRWKTCTVVREGRRWFAVLTIEKETTEPPPPVGTPLTPVGVDLGLAHLATLSTGEVVEPPRFLRRAEQRLRRAQRSLARKRKGSAHWQEQLARVQDCHAKVRDQRRDFAHQLTTRWVREHDLVAFEDLDLRSLARTGMAKSLLDGAWGELRRMTEYKEARRGGRYVEVPAAGTTQTCSRCGERADPPLTLKDREFRCPSGHREDRDVNAAKNVLSRALAAVGGDTPEVKPVETGPPPPRKGRRVRSRKREPPLVEASAPAKRDREEAPLFQRGEGVTLDERRAARVQVSVSFYRGPFGPTTRNATGLWRLGEALRGPTGSSAHGTRSGAFPPGMGAIPARRPLPVVVFERPSEAPPQVDQTRLVRPARRLTRVHLPGAAAGPNIQLRATRG